MRIFQVAQHADDLERATAFYADLLGTQTTGSFDPPGLVFFQVGTTRLLLEKGAPSALIYLEIPDVRAFAESWKAKGNQVESEPHIIFHHESDALGPEGTDEWMTFIRDSEGNLVGLVSHLPTS
jgi:methylmalonyl-CoA/ethylmalonyl-CoA epimerase